MTTTITRLELMKGLRLLGRWAGVDVAKDDIEIWWFACDDLTPEQWERGVKATIRGEQSFGRLPSPKVVRDHALGASAHTMNVEAMRAFQAVLRASNYHPEGGASWSYRGVEEKCGRAAAEAFVAAGGSDAFTFISDRDRPFLEKRFCEAYQAAASDAPESRFQLEPPKRPALPMGTGGGPTTIVWEQPPEKPKAPEPSQPTGAKHRDVTIDMESDRYAERMETLRRQREEVLG